MGYQLVEKLIRETSPEGSLALLPDIVTLLEGYCGMHLYPRQKTLLRMIYLELENLTDYDKMVIDEWLESSQNGGDVRIPLDFYWRAQKCKDEGYLHFREIINCFGRRAGKGFIGGGIACRSILELIALGNPQEYYGIDDGKTILSPFVATTVGQAQRLLFQDAKNTCMRCMLLRPYIYNIGSLNMSFQTPYDKEFNKALPKKFKAKQERATIHIAPMSTSSSSGRGDAAYFNMFDEFAFLSANKESTISGEEIYSAYTPSLDQFGKNALIYIPSSPYTEIGKFYELFQDAFEKDSFGHGKNWNMFCAKMPSWELYKDWEYDNYFKGAIQYSPEVNTQMKLLEERDPQKFSVERRANFQSVIDAYLDSKLVDRIFEPVEIDGININVEHKVGNIDRVYEAHADAAKVGDNFCYALGHGEIMPDGTTHAFIDLMLVWQGTDFDHKDTDIPYIDYITVYEQILQTLKDFYVNKITFDQFDSTLILQRLQKDVLSGKTFNHTTSCAVENFTSASNWKRYETFKVAVGQNWVHAPEVIYDITGLGKVNLLKHELKFLVQKNNRVDHPAGGHNDMSDCVSVIVQRILGEQVQAFESGLLTLVDGVEATRMGLDRLDNDTDNDRIIARGQKMMENLFEESGWGGFEDEYNGVF